MRPIVLASLAFIAFWGAAFAIPHATQGGPVETRLTISRALSGCLTDTDCDALADGAALIGYGCEAPRGETAWWNPWEPLYRDHEDDFPATCAAIEPVTVID
jgi:hypothetical protein